MDAGRYRHASAPSSGPTDSAHGDKATFGLKHRAYNLRSTTHDLTGYLRSVKKRASASSTSLSKPLILPGAHGAPSMPSKSKSALLSAPLVTSRRASIGTESSSLTDAYLTGAGALGSVSAGVEKCAKPKAATLSSAGAIGTRQAAQRRLSEFYPVKASDDTMQTQLRDTNQSQQVKMSRPPTSPLTPDIMRPTKHLRMDGPAFSAHKPVPELSAAAHSRRPPKPRNETLSLSSSKLSLRMTSKMPDAGPKLTASKPAARHVHVFGSEAEVSPTTPSLFDSPAMPTLADAMPAAIASQLAPASLRQRSDFKALLAPLPEPLPSQPTYGLRRQPLRAAVPTAASAPLRQASDDQNAVPTAATAARRLNFQISQHCSMEGGSVEPLQRHKPSDTAPPQSRSPFEMIWSPSSGRRSGSGTPVGMAPCMGSPSASMPGAYSPFGPSARAIERQLSAGSAWGLPPIRTASLGGRRMSNGSLVASPTGSGTSTPNAGTPQALVRSMGLLQPPGAPVKQPRADADARGLLRRLSSLSFDGSGRAIRARYGSPLSDVPSPGAWLSPARHGSPLHDTRPLLPRHLSFSQMSPARD